uniref:hypothetical protein n=1 Tax=Aliarcobacter sp. TaxID=2321116 RepID=UPI00404708E4
MDIEEFKKRNKPKRASILDKFKKEILELDEGNYSQKKIVDFLKGKGIKTTQQNVGMFLKRNKAELESVSSVNTNKSLDIKNKDIKKEEVDVRTTQLFNVDIKKKVGKDTSLKKPEWL